MYIRELGDVDAPALRALACVNSKRDWELATQEMVSVWLPDMLGEGRVAAAGGFEDDELVAVVSWASTDRDDTWVCPVLAVRLARQRRGAGRLMKQYLIEQARSHGVRVLLGSGKAQKNGPNDARSVAIAALRNDALGRVVLDDHARVLKLLVKRHRDLGRSKSKAACRLHALLMELEPGGMSKEMTVTRANEILDRIEPATRMAEHRLDVARETLADVAHYEALALQRGSIPFASDYPGHYRAVSLILGYLESHDAGGCRRS